MIDFHTHILPGIDDGSRRLADSLEMLRRLRRQGVDTVALTPHFLAGEPSVEAFLERRQAAFEALAAAADGDSPRLLPGAEVQYRPGIARLPGLERLCLQGTRVLLLEMRFAVWSEVVLREVCDLAGSGEYVVMLAHVERYFPLQRPSVWRRLRGSGALLQVNAEVFLAPAVRALAASLFRRGSVHVLGTDTHNLTTRAPHMDAAARCLTGRLGEESFLRWERQTYDLLEKWHLP